MKKYRVLGFLLQLLVSLLFYLAPIVLLGQINSNVPPSDPAYEYINDLQAWGLINGETVGTKPYTRYQFARLIISAKAKLQRKNLHEPYGVLEESLGYLSQRFKKEIEAIEDGKKSKIAIAPVQSVALRFFKHNSDDRRLPYRDIDAIVNPFNSYMEDLQLSEGKNIAFESSHGLSIGNVVDIFYQSRINSTNSLNSSNSKELDYETLRSYIQLSFLNLKLLIGKDSMVWGASSRSNLMLSSNTEPIGTFSTLPLIQISNRRQVKLPWLFKKLGPMRYVIFLARLEENRDDFDRPYFHGKRIDFKPSANFEFGLSHSFILGGNHFPASFSFLDAFAEVFFLRPRQNLIFNIRTGEVTSEGNIANHFGGVDFRYRFPSLRFTEVYGEIYANSINSHLFADHLGYNVGIFIPRILSDGRQSLRIEYTHTSTIYYTGSPPFTAGFTFNQRILGSDLGPLGNEMYIKPIFRPTNKTRLSAFFDYQRRGLGKFHDNSVTGTRSERRFITGSELSFAVSPKLSLSVEARYQWIRAFAHRENDNRTAYFGALSLQMFDIFN